MKRETVWVIRIGLFKPSFEIGARSPHAASSLNTWPVQIKIWWHKIMPSRIIKKVLLVVDLMNGDILDVILTGTKYQVWIGHGSLTPLRPLCLPHKGQAGPLQVGHLQWQQGIEPHVENHLWHLCVARWLKVQTLPRSWATFTSTREYETKEIEPFYSEQHQLYVWSLNLESLFLLEEKEGHCYTCEEKPSDFK